MKLRLIGAALANSQLSPRSTPLGRPYLVQTTRSGRSAASAATTSRREPAVLFVPRNVPCMW
eukprot:4121661-Prymnesium_polylepis.2